MFVRYLSTLNKGRLILWCYLIWYMVVLVRYFDPNPRLWLTSLGLWGKTAHDKFVPDVVFTLVPGEIACFLNRLFATDGWATVLASGPAGHEGLP